MSNADEGQVRAILQGFIRNTIPDYILEGAREIVDTDGVQKLDVKKRDQFWDVDGQIQGEDFQNYASELGLNLRDENVSFFCNCPESFSGVCKHVGAAALKLLSSLDGDDKEDAALVRADWRQTFRSFFATELEPEAGKHYLIFRFYPEPGRLQVAFFRARQNKSGISTVQTEATLAQITENPDWCEISPSLPRVAEQIGHYLDYSGHRVELPAGLHSWFFRAIKNEYYLYLRDSDQPLRIEKKTMQLKLSPQLSEEGLTFDILLSSEGKMPFSIIGEDEVFFYGRLPLWVFRKNAFYPVQTGLDPELIQEMVHQQPFIPHSDIPEFLDRVWTRIPISDLHDQEDFLEHMEPVFVEAAYNPKLFLDEEGSLLTLKIQNVYDTEQGEAHLPGPNPDLQTGSYHMEGRSCLIRRAQDEEARLFAELLDMGFQARNNHTWFMEQEEAIAFLLDHYPSLVEAYRVYGEKNLTRYKVRLTKPVITAEVESDEENQWFNLDLAVTYDDQKVPIELIWDAWTKGKRYVQLKDGSYTSLPESWLKRLGHKLKALGLSPDEPPKGPVPAVRGPGAGEDPGGPAPGQDRRILRQAARKDKPFRPDQAGGPAQGPQRHPAPLPGPGPVLPELPARVRVRRHPGGRDGPGQDHPDPVLYPAFIRDRRQGRQPDHRAHLGASQLGAGSREVRAPAQAADHLRHQARGPVRQDQKLGPDHHHLRPAQARPGRALEVPLRGRDPGRGPEHQEPQHHHRA